MNKSKQNTSTSKSGREEEQKGKKTKSSAEEEGELDDNSTAQSSESKRIKLTDKSQHHQEDNVEEEEEDDEAEDSEDASSSSSSEDSNAEVANENPSQLSSLLKKLDYWKNELLKDQHKYEKIERALAKAKLEVNKSNVEKCKKYKMKYEKKIDKNHVKIDAYKKKIARIKSKPKLTKKSSPEPKKTAASATKLDTSKQQIQTPQQVKIPYPVLNDKRDMNIIQHTLETKLNELLTKIVANRQLKQRPGQSKEQLDKINQLERTYESQRQKLIRQIDYIRLSLAVRATNSSDPTLVAQLNELYQMMKNENMQHRATNLDQSENQGQTSPKSSADSTSQSAINKSHETLIKSLVTVLAHTAACAHSTAAISAYNYAYYQYYQQLEEQKKSQTGCKKPTEPEPPLPLRVEIEKASNVFNKYKNKISTFFENSKKLETLTREIGDKIANESSGKPHLTSLNRLLIDYSDNEESDEEKEIVLDGEDEKEKPTDKEPVQNDENSVQVESEQVDSDDQDSDSEWEILTTSEIKSDAYNQNHKRNYLLPSVKSILFPLKATFDWNLDGNNENEDLIAIERSKHAITFMGLPRPVSDPIGGKRRTNLADILYGHKHETHG